MKFKALPAFMAAGIALICFFAVLPRYLVRADSAYSCDYDLVATLQPDNTVTVSQQINFTNLTSSATLPSLILKFPYTIRNATVYYGRRSAVSRPALGYNYQKGQLTVDLGDHAIKAGEKASLTINYRADGILTQMPAGQKILFVPLQAYCDASISTISVNYPADWNGPDYLSVSHSAADTNPIADTIASQAGIIHADGRKDIYAVWGNWRNTAVNVEWKLDNGKIVPLPSSSFNEFVFNSLPDAVNVYKDTTGNEYLELDNDQQYISGFAGSLSSRESPVDLPKLSQPYFQGDLQALLGIDLKSDRQTRYQQLLAKFKPQLTRNASPDLDLAAAVARPAQDALDYAQAWAAELEQEGLQPYILFGPAAFPLNHDIIWDYWVGVLENGHWVQYDPYLEAVMGFDGYMKVTPQHYAWGIITASDLFLASGLSNITNISSLIVDYNQPQLVLGDSFNVEAALDVRNSLLRQVGLNISNNGSNIIFLQDLKVLSTTFPEKSMQQLGILPGQHKYIDLTSYVSWQALLKDQGLLSGQLQLFSNGKVYPLKTNPAYIDTYWLFPVVFVFLFVAFVFIIRLLQQKASGLATIFFPGSLWRSWGDVFKAGWKKTLLLLQRKGQVEPLPPPLEPADLPDLPNAETVAPLYELEETEPDEHGYYRHYKEV